MKKQAGNVSEPLDSGQAGAAEQRETAAHYETLIRDLTLPQGWSVAVDEIIAQPQVRLDAEHYDPLVRANHKALSALGYDLVPLSEFASIRLPGLFTRIWAKDDGHGLPYINATDLMSYFALGMPAQERFLSFASQVNMSNLILRQGMILLTCSGTIGRVFDVPPALDGVAGTHDIVRIIPHEPHFRGFLRAYLTTRWAQIQILSHTHGGQIDHVTDQQVASCLVPRLPDKVVRDISRRVDEADAGRSASLAALEGLVGDLNEALTNAE